MFGKQPKDDIIILRGDDEKSIFIGIILLIFSAFLFCISLVANGSTLGLILLLIWVVGVVVGLRVFSHPRFAKYHKFI